MNYNFVEIGQRIRQERKKARISQESLCAEIGISRNTLSDYESGKNFNITNMSLETLLNLCRVFKCDVGYLLGEYKERRHTAADICAVTGLSETSVEVLCKKPEVTDEDRETMPEDFIDWGFSIDRDALDKLFASQFFSEFMRSIKECVDVVSNPPLEVQLATYAESLIPEKQKEMREAAHSFARDIMQRECKAQDRALIFETQYAAAKIAEEIIQSARKKEGGNGI